MGKTQRCDDLMRLFVGQMRPIDELSVIFTYTEHSDWKVKHTEKISH